MSFDNLWLLSLRYEAISRRHMSAAFTSALQACDELQHSDVVTRLFIARADTIKHHLTPEPYFIFHDWKPFDNYILLSSPKCLFRWHVSSYVGPYHSGESMFFRWWCIHQSLPTPLRWLCCKYLDDMSVFLEYQSWNAIDISQDTSHGRPTSIHWQQNIQLWVYTVFSSHA